eukprot:356022-Chlamydomonas_euryale.AAC.3
MAMPRCVPVGAACGGRAWQLQLTCGPTFNWLCNPMVFVQENMALAVKTPWEVYTTLPGSETGPSLRLYGRIGQPGKVWTSQLEVPLAKAAPPPCSLFGEFIDPHWPGWQPLLNFPGRQRAGLLQYQNA